MTESVEIELSAKTGRFESQMADMAALWNKQLDEVERRIATLGVKPIASLEPGKRYVIQVEQEFHTDEEYERFVKYLHFAAPECKFLVLEGSARLVASIPEEETSLCTRLAPHDGPCNGLPRQEMAGGVATGRWCNGLRDGRWCGEDGIQSSPQP